MPKSDITQRHIVGVGVGERDAEKVSPRGHVCLQSLALSGRNRGRTA